MSGRMVFVVAVAALLLAACGRDAGIFELAVGDCFEDPELVEGRVHEVD